MNRVATRSGPPRSRFGLALIAIGAALVLVGTVGLATAAPHRNCGEERAAVKLGLDDGAARVAAEPVDTTIAELTGLPKPRTTPAAERASDVERTVYRLSATITAYKLEADGDFHVVISDGTRTMIVEIPSPDCLGDHRTAPAFGAGKPRAVTVSVWRDQVVSARTAMLRLLADGRHPAPSQRLQRVNIPITVTGVGFFDFIHGQVGVAPNGIELHPVLAIATGVRSS